jgi:hypothetical protein
VADPFTPNVITGKRFNPNEKLDERLKFPSDCKYP